MRILMLGNSFTYENDLPGRLAGLLGAQVAHHTRGGARLAEQLNPRTRLGARTLEALQAGGWDYVVLQEMSNGPITAPASFYRSVGELCRLARQGGGEPVLYATWAYQAGGEALAKLGMDAGEMSRRLYEAYHRAGEENRALVADVGERFAALAPTQPLYAGDGIHPSPLGTQLAAETIARVIRGR